MANSKKSVEAIAPETLPITETSTNPQIESVANDTKSENTNEVKDEITSENLTKIQGEIKTKMLSIAKETDFTKQLAILQEVQKLQTDEKIEIATVRKAIAEQKENEKRDIVRNELQAVVDTFKKSFDAEKSDISIEEKNIVYDAYKNQFDKVLNMLFGKSHIATVSSKSVGTGGEVKGSKSARIEEMMRAGNTKTDMLNEGLGDGTIRTVAGAIRFSYNGKTDSFSPMS